MISKELLSEVLYNNQNYIDSLRLNDIIGAEKSIQYISKVSGRPFDYVNIYELAHKCKEWAFNQEDYSIVTGRTYRGYYCSIHREIPNGLKQTDYISDTEPEAIFKACQWILDNKED